MSFSSAFEVFEVASWIEAGFNHCLLNSAVIWEESLCTMDPYQHSTICSFCLSFSNQTSLKKKNYSSRVVL